MTQITKRPSLVSADNEHRVRALCTWIAANCQRRVTWGDLTRESGLSHRDLITIFEIYVHVSPMTYLRKCRELRQSQSSGNQSLSLFESPDDAEK